MRYEGHVQKYPPHPAMTDFELQVKTDVYCRACDKVVATLAGETEVYEAAFTKVIEAHRTICPARTFY